MFFVNSGRSDNMKISSPVALMNSNVTVVNEHKLSLPMA